MTDTVTIANSSAEYSLCTVCLICGNAIPIQSPYHASPRICDECKKRLMKVLYHQDESINININCNDDPIEIAHVGYTAEQCGYEK